MSGWFTKREPSIPQWYPGTWADSDGDGIPDSVDPYPNDPNNNSAGSGQFFWGGGSFLIDNTMSRFPAQWYPGSWADSDGDGIPDSLDPYPNDANNGNGSTTWWPGGTFTVSGQPTTFAGQFYSGTWMDTDGDGIPDFLDPYPYDSSNNTAWWPGGTFLINGQSTALPGAWHQANAGDADNDAIPDDLDPYPNDPWNGTYFIWPSQSTSFVINDQTTSFNPTTYAGIYVDSDGDGIPDVADPYPNDANNGNSQGGNGGCACGHGGCPTGACAGASNPANCTCQNPSTTDNSGPDSDSDGMGDSYERANGLDLNNPVDAADAPMGDSVFNREKAQGGVAIATVVNDPALFYQLTGHAMSWLMSQINNPTKSVAENDWDNDGISNIDELLVFHTDPRDPNSRPTDDQIRQALSEGKCSLTTRANFLWLLGCTCGQSGCPGATCSGAQDPGHCVCQSGSGGGGGIGGSNPCTCQFAGSPPNGGCTCAASGACNNDCVTPYSCQCMASGCNCTAGSNCGGQGNCVTVAYSCKCGGNICTEHQQCTAKSHCDNQPQLERCMVPPPCTCSVSGEPCWTCLYQDACLENGGNGDCRGQAGGPPPLQVTVEGSDYVIPVSSSQDPDIAVQLSISLTAGDTNTYTAAISLQGDGNIQFDQTSVSVGPGGPTKVKMWGTTPSSAQNTTTIIVNGTSGNSQASGQVNVTVIDGIKLSFSGTFCSTIDSRNEGWRPGITDKDESAPAGTANAPAEVMAADSPDFNSTISFTQGDQPLQLRPWTPQPNVTVTKIEALNPPMELANDDLKGGSVNVTSGRFQHNHSQHELIQHPVFKLKTLPGFSVVSMSIVDRGDDSAIISAGTVPGINVRVKINTAAAGGNKLAKWLQGGYYYLDALGRAHNFDQRSFLNGISTAKFSWNNAKFDLAKGDQVKKSAAAKAILAAQELRGHSSTSVQMMLDSWDGWDLTGKVEDGKLTTP